MLTLALALLAALLAPRRGGRAGRAPRAALARPPAPVPTAYVCTDPELADAFMRAADEWADSGIEVAERFTMNAGGAGVPVRWGAPGEMLPLCQHPEADDAHGCVNYESNGSLKHIVVRNDVRDPQRLHVVLLHEIGHVISGRDDHLLDEIEAIMSPECTANAVTNEDLDYVCSRGCCAS